SGKTDPPGLRNDPDLFVGRETNVLRGPCEKNAAARESGGPPREDTSGEAAFPPPANHASADAERFETLPHDPECGRAGFDEKRFDLRHRPADAPRPAARREIERRRRRPDAADLAGPRWLQRAGEGTQGNRRRERSRGGPREKNPFGPAPPARRRGERRERERRDEKEVCDRRAEPRERPLHPRAAEPRDRQRGDDGHGARERAAVPRHGAPEPVPAAAVALPGGGPRREPHGVPRRADRTLRVRHEPAAPGA